jgi:hypothetical protein
MARKETSDKPAERYPSIARWCDQHGRIELGHDWQDKLFARALHDGGLAWGGKRQKGVTPPLWVTS